MKKPTIFVSHFPFTIVASLPNKTVFIAHDFDELALEMLHAGINEDAYDWIEFTWKQGLFPMLATWSKSADGTIFSTLPNGAKFSSKNEDELLVTIVEAGATGLVPNHD